MYIPKIDRSSRVAEVAITINRVLTPLESSVWETETYIPGLVSAIKPKLEAYEKALKQTTTESDLKELDDNRAEPIRHFGGLIGGYQYHPSKRFQDAAAVVMNVFSKYGVSVTEESYAVESMEVRSMVGELKEPEVVEAAAVLPGASELIVQIEETLNAFDEARAAFDEAKGKESSRQSASDLKDSLLTEVNEKLIAYIKGVAAVDEAKYGDLARTLKEIIDSNNDNVKRRSSK